MTHARTEPRVSPLPASEWSDEVRALLAASGGSGDRTLNIFATLARYPKLLKRWLVFSAHILFKSSLPARERELLILRTGFRCKSDYEFHQHSRLALASGVTADEVQRTRADASLWQGSDATLLRAVDELIDDKRIGDATWDALRKQLTEPQLFDLIFTVGQYTLVSMALNTLGVQIEDDAAGSHP